MRAGRNSFHDMNKTEIANIALGHLGSALIQSIEEVSPSAEHIRRMWNFTRDGLLRQKDWNFAINRATLSRLGVDPPFDWEAAYQLPADYIRCLSWNGMEAGTGVDLFDIESGMLLCDVDASDASPRAELRYIRRAEDTSMWDASFVEAFSYRIAAAICPAMTTSAGLSDAMMKNAEMAMLKAFGPDNLETRPRAILAQENSGYMDARRGAYNW